MESKFVDLDHIRLHFLDYPADGPTLILMHGLTSNAYCFEGIMQRGLLGNFRVISVDLRGRGLSDKPEAGYAMADHAGDIIGLMDALNISNAHIGGHSFGAWISFYMAAHFPKRVDHLVLIDAAAEMHPEIRQMLVPVLGRLGKTFSSFEAYLDGAVKAPFVTFWDPAMLPYYQADVARIADGAVMQRSRPEHMQEAITKVLEEPWLQIINGLPHKAILFNATEPYTLQAPLLPKDKALETVQLMEDCVYKEIKGNHLTMLYGEGADQIATAIREFI